MNNVTNNKPKRVASLYGELNRINTMVINYHIDNFIKDTSSPKYNNYNRN